GECGACTVLMDGQPVPSCQVSVRAAQHHEITTLESLGTATDLHPLQAAFIEENAAQCGFCTSGMIVTAKALLDRSPHPDDDEIRAAMAGNLCRCGVYDRVRRAIKRASGQPEPAPYEQLNAQPPGSASEIVLPRPLQQNPDLDDWVRINADGTVTLFTGKVELGQDLRTSVAMIGADELDVALDRVRVVTAETGRTPNEGYTVSSMSLETTGNAIRYAAAEVRRLALDVAYETLEVPRERLTITDGTIADPVTGRSVTYWELFGDRAFGTQVTGTVRPKGPEAYRILGRPTGRLDMLAKVTGQAGFVHDLDLPDMVHGRVVRPPTYEARLRSVDAEAVLEMPGVLEVVRDGSFLGVVAEREEQAVRAMEALGEGAVWEGDAELPPYETLFDHLRSQPAQASLVVDGRPVPGPAPPVEAPPDAAQTLTATYERPYHAHASLGPSAAVARWDDETLTIWTHSQGVYPLRAELAQVLRTPEEAIHAIHMPGPGCYGHNGADDAALDAALLARAVPGRAVSLKWTRADEHAWEPYGAATVIQMQGSLSAEGELIDWNHDVRGYAHTARSSGVEGSSSLLAAWHLEEPFSPPEPRPIMAPEVGIHRNANP
ncbi:MAG: 2Fe-2S iron-sulfur cluster-binding protein, partial [Anaerolineae bacterium]